MKTFKQFIKKIPCIPSPIHFKQVSKSRLNEMVDNPDHWPSKGHGMNDHLLADRPKLDTLTDNEYISKKLSSGQKMNSNEKSSATDYSGTEHAQSVNWSLLDAHDSGKEVKHSTIKHLDSAIKKNPLQHEVHVYSGAGFDPMKHMNDDKLMHSPAFISTTHSRRVAYNHAKPRAEPDNTATSHIIHLHLKKGDPAINISHHSQYPGEHETVIGRNVTLQHHGYEDHPDGFNVGHKIRVHHMSIVKK